jgi:hypothetical protein
MVCVCVCAHIQNYIVNHSSFSIMQWIITKYNNTPDILVCWSIWRERNAQIFEGSEKQRHHLVDEIKNEAKQWSAVGAKQLSKLVVPMIRE